MPNKKLTNSIKVIYNYKNILSNIKSSQFEILSLINAVFQLFTQETL